MMMRVLARLTIGLGAAVAASACGKEPRAARHDDAAAVEPHDELRLVPAGWFTSGRTGTILLDERRLGGSPDDDSEHLASASWLSNPPRRRWLSAYEIGRTEVTRGEYRTCVVAGACPDVLGWDRDVRRASPRDEPRWPARVRFEDAERYCAWRGLRLPTAAEWEKAARGTSGRLFPWGDDVPTCSLAAFERDHLHGIEASTCRALGPVGQRPHAESPFGLLDAYGNAGEWTSDRFTERVVTQLEGVPGVDHVEREARDGYVIYRPNWRAYRFAWVDPAIIDPAGPATWSDAKHEGRRVVMGAPSVVDRHVVPYDTLLADPDLDDQPGSGFRCARSAPGPAPPEVPAMTPDELTYPYREDAP